MQKVLHVFVFLGFSFFVFFMTACGNHQQSTTVSCHPLAKTITQQASTKNYRMLLMIGEPEPMYTPEQVKKSHPTDGEIMVRGSMNMVGMGSSAICARHVEIHIYPARGNTPILDADNNLAILLINGTSGEKTRISPVAMYGMREGISDFHYGNQQIMPSNQQWSIVVTYQGETATFKNINT